MSNHYNYIVRLEIANDKKRDSFNLKTIEKKIEEAIEKYHSLDTVRNKKNLSCIVNEKMLEISINSPVQLDYPSKALAKFTRILLELSPELGEIVSNGRVFQSVQTTIPASDIDKISSVDTLKKLIEIFCNDITSEEQLLQQRKIKSILFNVEK